MARVEQAGRIVAALLGFVVIVFGAQDRLNKTYESVWSPSPGLFAGVAIAAGAAALLTAVYDVVMERRRRSFEQEAAKIDRECVLLANKVSELTGVELKYIGCSVFKVQRRVRSRRFPFVRPRQRLYRHPRWRFRLRHFPGPSGVAWSEGKGAVGAAWSTKRGKHQPWRSIANRYSGRTLTEPSFLQISEQTRQGFSREEFLTILDKYSEVYAHPITDAEGRSVLGVVSLDIALDAVLQPHQAGSDRLLDSTRVKTACATTAVGLRSVWRSD